MQTATRQELLDALADGWLPGQGAWSADEYLWLTPATNRLIEFAAGTVEALPPPTTRHQLILQHCLLAFHGAVGGRGRVLFAALRLRVNAATYREPDLLLLLDAADPRNQDRYWTGADLVLEVVGSDDPDRDLVTKRREYAAAGISEYWIVNPLNETITVLALRDGTYAAHGVFARGQGATSPLLPGLAIAVSTTFDAR